MSFSSDLVSVDIGRKHSVFQNNGNNGGKTPILIQRFNSSQLLERANKIGKAGFFDRLFRRSIKISFDDGKSFHHYLKKDVGSYLAGVSESKRLFSSVEQIPSCEKKEARTYQVALQAFTKKYSKGKTSAEKASSLGSAILSLTHHAALLKKDKDEDQLKATFHIEKVMPTFNIARDPNSIFLRSSIGIYWTSLFDYIHIESAKKTNAIRKPSQRRPTIVVAKTQPQPSVDNDFIGSKTKTSLTAMSAALGFATGGPVGAAVVAMATQGTLSLTNRLVSWWNS